MLENEYYEHCGEGDSIYVGKTLADDGTCLKCGEINDLTVCPKCNSQFVGGTIDEYGTMSFCDICQEEIENF